MKKSLIGVLAIALVFGMVGTTLAADWNFYGSARMAMFWQTYDDKASSAQETGASTLAESDTDLDMHLQTNARIGANVKAGDVSGRFEYGSGPNLRLLYGTWNFGAGSLTVGQAYTPIDCLIAHQVIDDDINMLKDGMTYEGRKPLLQLQFAGLKIALVQPSVSGENADTDIVIPKVEVSYDFKADMFSVGGYGGFQTWSQRDTGDEDETLSAYVLGVRFGVTPGMFYVKGNVFWAQNAGNYGILLRNGSGGSAVVGTEVTDATTIAGAVVVGAKFSDMLAVEGGIGYGMNEADVSGGTKTEGDWTTYYVQLPITLAKGVYIVPEVSIFDLGDTKTTTAGVETTTENGTISSFGAKFQINF